MSKESKDVAKQFTREQHSEPGDLSSSLGIPTAAAGSTRSIDSIPDVMPPPQFSSTPTGLNTAFVDMDTSLDTLERLQKFYAAEAQRMRDLKEKQQLKKEQMKSSCVTLELHKDEKYDMAEYNLDEYKDKDKLEYMRVSMAKMGYHIIKSAEAYESAFSAFSDMQAEKARQDAAAMQQSTEGQQCESEQGGEEYTTAEEVVADEGMEEQGAMEQVAGEMEDAGDKVEMSVPADQSEEL